MLPYAAVCWRILTYANMAAPSLTMLVSLFIYCWHST
jgi:hypothetical protein